MGGTALLVHKGSYARDLHHDPAPNSLSADGARVDEPAHCADADTTKLAGCFLQVPKQGVGTHQSASGEPRERALSVGGEVLQGHFVCDDLHPRSSDIRRNTASLVLECLVLDIIHGPHLLTLLPDPQSRNPPTAPLEQPPAPLPLPTPFPSPASRPTLAPGARSR